MGNPDENYTLATLLPAIRMRLFHLESGKIFPFTGPTNHIFLFFYSIISLRLLLAQVKSKSSENIVGIIS